MKRLTGLLVRFLKWSALGALALGIAGGAANAWYARRDAERFQAPGRLVTIGDHALHLHCTGAGGPTVILEAGLGGWSIHGERLQRELAKSVRVCSYDRSGLGWSGGGGDQYDIATSARELHALLRASGEAMPIVLVGHSLGGNIAAYYAAQHPKDLAGVVLVDPGTPEDLLEDYEGTESEAKAIARCGWKCGAASLAANLGVVRLIAHKAGSKSMSDRANEQYRAGLARASTVRTLVGVLEFLPKSAWQMREARTFGNVPMTIVYSAERRPQGEETPADVARWHAQTMDRMRLILRGTTRGRGPLVVPGTNHLSVIAGPQGAAAVASETMRLVGEARKAKV